MADIDLQKEMMSNFLANMCEEIEESPVTRKDLRHELDKLAVDISGSRKPSIRHASDDVVNRDSLLLKLDNLTESISPLAASIASLATSVHHMETRLSLIESK